jgi:hypothetical protein
MHVIPSLGLLLAAAIHLLPVSGAISNERLFKLYRVRFTDPNLIIMMRHRAAMFGIVAALMIAACFDAALRHAAFGVGFASAGSFLVIAWSVGGYSKAISRVVFADVVAVAALAVGFVFSL